MSKELVIVEKHRALKMAWTKYLEKNKLSTERLFLNGKEPTAKIYDLFFAEKPKVKLQFIEPHRKAAQKLYEKLTFNAASEGMTAKEQHALAIQNKGFAEIYAKAKLAVKQKIGAKLAEFLTSDDYDKFLETQIDGSLLSDEMGMSAICNRELATAKLFMVKGKKNSAKSYLKNAVKKQADHIAKQKKVPKNYKPLTEAELFKKLDKFDVGVPQKL